MERDSIMKCCSLSQTLPGSDTHTYQGPTVHHMNNALVSASVINVLPSFEIFQIPSVQ